MSFPPPCPLLSTFREGEGVQGGGRGRGGERGGMGHAGGGGGGGGGGGHVKGGEPNGAMNREVMNDFVTK